MKKFFKKTNKKLSQKLAIVFLMVAMLIPVNYLYNVPEAEAQLGGTIIIGDTSVSGIKTAVESTLTTANTLATSLGVTSLSAKETFLDGIFQMAAKVFLRKMVSSIITWINSGFEGSPAFVTDLQGFMLETADEVVGQFIYESDSLDFLCSPFQLDVKIALAQQYSAGRPGNYQPQCTMSEVVDNMEGFYNGNFSDGGWPGYFELVTSEENNPTHAYFNAQAEMYLQIANEQGEEITKLDFGNGFFSMEVCDVAEKASGAKPNCVIGTPGSVIANSINTALDAGTDELIAADEINEIFNALFSQLALKTFEGAYGLLGLGGNDSYSQNTYGESGNLSYLNAIAEADEKMTIDTSYVSQSINYEIRTEKKYLSLQKGVQKKINEAKKDYDKLEDTCSINLEFPEELEEARTEANRGIAVASTSILVLETIKGAMENADTVETQQAAFDQYSQIKEEGLLHSTQEVVELEQFIQYDLDDLLEEFERELEEEEDNCTNSI